MRKPDERIASAAEWDYGIAHRVARRLEKSPLHVYGAVTMMGLPAAIGDPNDLTQGLFQELALVTDGRRGWLVLADREEAWDAEVEVAELVGSVLEDTEGPPPWRVRTVADDREPSGEALDLRDALTARRRIEDEFERHFGRAAATRVETLLEALRSLGYGVWDEAALRREMNEAPSTPPGVTPLTWPKRG